MDTPHDFKSTDIKQKVYVCPRAIGCDVYSQKHYCTPHSHGCQQNVEKTLALSSWCSPNHRPFTAIYRTVHYLIRESVSFSRGVDGESCLNLMLLKGGKFIEAAMVTDRLRTIQYFCVDLILSGIRSSTKP